VSRGIYLDNSEAFTFFVGLKLPYLYIPIISAQ
jgi:hypothetical protein